MQALLDRGFALFDGVLAPGECEAWVAALERGGAMRGRAGTRHLLRDPATAGMASDPRLLALASEALGGSCVPYRATLFSKTARANWLVVWHQDTALPMASRSTSPEWGPWSTKEGILYAHAPAWALERVVALRVHLDASTLRNGPLRVLPGSHRSGVLTDDEVFAAARDGSPEACLGGQGSVLAMRPLLIHASSKLASDLPRRVLHVEYSRSLDLGCGLTLARA